MDQNTRLNSALNRLAAATSVTRTRAYDAARAERDGLTREEQLESVIARLEDLADELWKTLDTRPKLGRVA